MPDQRPDQVEIAESSARKRPIQCSATLPSLPANSTAFGWPTANSTNVPVADAIIHEGGGMLGLNVIQPLQTDHQIEAALEIQRPRQTCIHDGSRIDLEVARSEPGLFNPQYLSFAIIGEHAEPDPIAAPEIENRSGGEVTVDDFGNSHGGVTIGRDQPLVILKLRIRRMVVHAGTPGSSTFSRWRPLAASRR